MMLLLTYLHNGSSYTDEILYYIQYSIHILKQTPENMAPRVMFIPPAAHVTTVACRLQANQFAGLTCHHFQIK